MLKTLIHHLVYVNEKGEIVEKVGSWESEKDAKNIMKDAKKKEGLNLEIHTEITNDKSGKATPVDRILIIAPESSHPTPFLSAEEMKWDPFFTPKEVTLDDFIRN
jgi:hypothetical protein